MSPAEAVKVTLDKPPRFSASGELIGFEDFDPQLLVALGVASVMDYGTYLVGEVAEADLAPFQTAAVQRLIRFDIRRDFDLVQVNGYSFSSFGAPLDLPQDLVLDAYQGGVQLYLVQVEAPVTAEWHAGLVALGAVIGYLPENTFLVRAPAAALPRLRAADGVQHVSLHQPAYKLPPSLLASEDAVVVDLELDGGQDLEPARAFLSSLTAQAVEVSADSLFAYARVQLAPAQVRLVARRPEVLWLERALPVDWSGERLASIVAGRHNGTQLAGATSGYFIDDPGDDYYRCFGGTSAAAPAVTAAAVLAEAWYYYFSPGMEDQLPMPSPAMLRAMLVAQAENLEGGIDRLDLTALPPSPSLAQGWGRVNLEKLFHREQPEPVAELFWDQDHQPTDPERRFTASDEFWKTELQVADPSKDIIAVMVYTDRFAQEGAESLTVNNLDLNIFRNDISPEEGYQYWGNRFGAGSWYSENLFGQQLWVHPGDKVNTVEVIRIEAGELTIPFWIRVEARKVSANAVPGLDGGSPNQDFALYVYNATEAP